MLFYEVDDVFFVGRDAIHTDSFAEIDQVRGGVETYLVACRLEDSCQGVRARAFAIGACHMDGLELSMRMAEVLVQQVGVLQSFLVGVLAHVLEEGSAIV